MINETKIREILNTLLNEVAQQARNDASVGKSNIGSIYDRSSPDLVKLDEKAIKQAIEDINKVTATKEGTARLVNALLVAAKTIAAVTIRPT